LTGTSDPVGLTLASIGAGSSTGAAIVTTGMILFRSLPDIRDPEHATDVGFLLITLSLLVGGAAAVAAGWFLTRALADAWRRAVVGALSVFGTMLLSAVSMPADLVGGRPALTAYLVALIAAATFAYRAALRAASQ